jgi:mannosyltransferase
VNSTPQLAAETSSAELREAAQRRDSGLLLCSIVALGAALRLYELGGKSFWLDEIASVVIARMPGNSFWWWLWHDEGNMALYYVMLRPWLQIHLGEATVRLLSVLPGIASIPMMYLLGARLFGRRIGLLAALFLALSTCSVVYSQEARGYSWLLLGVITSTYLFARLIAGPRYAIALWYGLAAGATFYFHYFGLLVPLAHALSLVALPEGRLPWKQLLLAGVMMTALAAPVLWMIHIQPVRHLDWVQKPSLLELYHLGVFLAAESGKGVGPALLALELVLVGIFLRAMAVSRGLKFARSLKNGEPCGTPEGVPFQIPAENEFANWSYALVASGLFTPVVITLLVSLVRPVFFHRFLIICLPAWLLAVAVGARAIQKSGTKRLTLAGVCVLSLVSTVISYTRVREDWRGVANYLIDHAAAQDRVLYYEGVGNFATESYREWLPGGRSNRPTAVEVNPPAVAWREKIAGAGRVWLVRYPAIRSDDTARVIEADLQSRYMAMKIRQFRAVTVTEYVAKP